MSNLLEKAENAAEVDVSLTKILIIGGLTIILAIGFGHFLKIFLDGDFSALLTVAISAFLFIIVAFFQSICVKSASFNYIFVLIASVALTLSFLADFSYSLFIAWLAALYFLSRANRLSANKIKNQLKIGLTEISKKFFPKTIMGLVFFSTIIYAGSLASKEQIVTPQLLNTLFISAEPLVQKLAVKDFKWNMSISQLAETIALSKLTPAQQTYIKQNPAALTALLDQTIQSLQSQLKGIELKPQETILQNLANFINQNFSQLSAGKITPLPQKNLLISFILNNLKTALLTVVAVGLALAVKWTIALIHYPLYGIAWLVYEILIALGFIKIFKTTIPKEVISL